MKIKTVRLDDLTRSVLLRSTIDGCNLTLPEQLAREDYQRVAKAIEAAGGKWNRKARCHIFPHDVRETLNLTADSVEVVNVQQTFQAFYTPDALARRMVALADIWCVQRVLEPSAGNGAIVEHLVGKTAKAVVAVEINPSSIAELNQKWPGVETHCADFMACNGDLGVFDRIVMNPPFTGGQDIAHIKHARTFLKRGGKLVAICANGPKQRKALGTMTSEWIDLEQGTFTESGTDANTAMIIMET